MDCLTFICIAVLRNVLWPQRRDAQTGNGFVPYVSVCVCVHIERMFACKRRKRRPSRKRKDLLYLYPTPPPPSGMAGGTKEKEEEVVVIVCNTVRRVSVVTSLSPLSTE